MSRSYSICSPNMFDIWYCIFVRTVVFTSWKIFETSAWTDTNNERSKNTNVKSEINKLSTNKRSKFLENIVPVNDSSEQKWNGYFHVDVVFTLDQTNASFICGIKLNFSIMNLHLFSKYMSSDLKSLSSLWFDMRSVCYLLCSKMHSDRSGKWHRNCNKELQVCVW